MRDIKTVVDVAQSLAPAARTATVNGSGIDLSGYGSAMAIVEAGVVTDGTHTPKLQESSDNSTFSDVAAADQLGTFAALSSSSVQRVGYIGFLRYIRVVLTIAGATTGALSSAVVARSHAAQNPLP